MSHGPLRAGIVWDLDHTLYQGSDLISAPWYLALSKLAVQRGYFDTLEDAAAYFKKSTERYGHHSTQLEMDFDVDGHEFGNTAMTMIENQLSVVDLITPCDLTMMAITSHKHIPQVVLTSADRAWASRVIRHINLHTHFADNHVVAFEDADRMYKGNSRVPFDRAAAAIGLPLEQLIMVEDNINNLAMAKTLGMGTVLVTHGDEPTRAVDHVDFIVHKAYDVFSLINQGQISWANGLLS